MREPSQIEIDLGAVSRNMAVLRRLVGPDVALCPVVKSDAYGLGAARIAPRLAATGADLLAVYTPQQAAELFRAAVRVPVLLLMPVDEIGRADELYRGLVSGRLHLSVHGPEHLERLVHLTERFAVTLQLHLDVDTGMSRGGCELADAPAILERIARTPRLQLVGVGTQFAASDSDPQFTQHQNDLLGSLLAAHADLVPPGCLVHAANTCAVLRNRSLHRTMVRVGQAWAGYGPELVQGGAVLPQAVELSPCVRWTSEVIHVKRIGPDRTVGYGRTWRTTRSSIIGLVPVGYADGYPWSLGRATEPPRVAVLVERPDGVRRAWAPVVGNVNMDQVTLDLTDLAAEDGTPLAAHVNPGTPVEMITPDREAPNHLVRLAEFAGTNPYEILCRLSPRIRRVYRIDAPLVETKVVVSAPAAQAL